MINQAGVVTSDPSYSCSLQYCGRTLTKTGRNMFFMELDELMDYFDSIPDESDDIEPSNKDLKNISLSN